MLVDKNDDGIQNSLHIQQWMVVDRNFQIKFDSFILNDNHDDDDKDNVKIYLGIQKEIDHIICN